MTGSLHLHWFLPGHGDGRELAKAPPGQVAGRPPRREPDIGYLAQVAAAAEQAGFTGALVPFGMFCEDPWLVSAALAASTRRLRFMIAVRPGLTSATLLAQMAATFQRLSGDRLLLNVVTGGDADEQRRYGDWLDHDQRYQRTEEYVALLRRLWAGERVDLEGRHQHVSGAVLTRPPRVPPALFIGGSSAGAQAAAAHQGDVYLAWGETPAQLAELMSRARSQAEVAGRAIGYGSRFHVITRDTAEEAWDVAHRLLATMDPERVAQAQRRFARSESEGQRRAAQLHGGRPDALEVHPNIWVGYGLVRPGVGAALVGSHAEVAERICELHGIGLDHLILSGQPHLEEAYAVAEGVLPILRARGVLAADPVVAGARPLAGVPT